MSNHTILANNVKASAPVEFRQEMKGNGFFRRRANRDKIHPSYGV